MDFLSYIGQHYEEIKKMLSQYNDFNEDVFHNTIISCNKAIQNRPIGFNTDNDIIRYFISSYRTNLLREHNYYHNKNVSAPGAIPDISESETKTESIVDFNLVMELIKTHFSEQEYNAYYRYITEDISIQELQKQTKIKNLKAKIKAIKTYIKGKS